MRARTLALALVAAPALVGAKPHKDVPRHAKQLAAKGRAAHAAGAYGDAILAYREAYGIAPSPSLLFNIAQAYRLAGNCHAAVQMYRRYIAEGPEQQVRSLAETHLADVERCAAAPSRDRIARAPQGLMPNGDATLDATLDATGDVPGAGTPGRTKKRIGVGLMVTGVVAFGFAGSYALDARDASLTVEEAYARGVKWRDVQDIAADGERSATIAKTLALTGGVALVSGIVVYALGKRAERLAPVAVSSTRGGAEVSWAWRF
jgi:tetratricopeptide (TPR) repeat protein